MGFIDRSGKVVIHPQYDGIKPFNEGLAVVFVGDRCWYIDKAGRMITKARFVTAFDFSDGLAAVRLPGQKMGYIDKTGKWVIKPQFDSADSFSEGLAFVMNKSADGNYSEGYIDKTGRMVIKGLGGGDFSGGIAFVGEEDQQFFIDKNGSRVSPNIQSLSDSSLEFSEGFAAFNKNNNWKWGYVDTKGRVVVKQRFDVAREFHEGLASVSVDDKRIGFIDKQGNWAIKPRTTWRVAGDFHEGLASVQSSSGKFGFIDKKGKWVIAPKFVRAGNFSEGLAAAYRDKKWGYINKQGRWVIRRPDYLRGTNLEIDYDDDIWSFHEGMAPCIAKR